MANKRDLKKSIKYICGDLASECVFAIELMPNIDKATMRKAIDEIAELQSSTIGHLTFSFDKTPRDFNDEKSYRKAREEYMKKAYASIEKEFNEKVEKIVKMMNSALPSTEAKNADANA